MRTTATTGAALWLVLTVAAASGGAAAKGAVDPPGPSPASCTRVPGMEALLDAEVVLVGELHGTVESPEFVAALVCGALRAGRSVTVGVEWVAAESERVEAFLRSDGARPARAALLSGDIWQARGEAQYGATSEAMFDLLESVRRWRAEGDDVGVYLFNRYGGGSQERDRLMAEALAEHLGSSTRDLLVVLTGNVHSGLTVGTRWDPEFRPMGLLLRRARPEAKIVALDVAHAGGTAWLCISGEPCGARRQGPRGVGGSERFAVSLSAEVGANGHHGSYFVGPIEASPPAVSVPDRAGEDRAPAAARRELR